MTQAKGVSVQRLRELFFYNPEIGTLIWKAKGGRGGHRHYALQPAGGVGGNGYLYTSVDGNRILNHRIAWAMFHGAWPDGHIDHANRVKTDNKVDNLRIASRFENLRNVGIQKRNTSGVRGVCWDGRRSKWHARIRIDGRDRFLGYFANLDDAHLVRRVAEHQYWGGIHAFPESAQGGATGLESS